MVKNDPIKVEEALARLRRQRQEAIDREVAREIFMKAFVKAHAPKRNPALERWLKQYDLTIWDVMESPVTRLRYIQVWEDVEYRELSYKIIHLPDKFQNKNGKKI